MKTYRELLRQGREQLREAGIQDWETDAWLLFEFVFEMHRTQYFLREEEIAGEEQERRYCELLRKRAERIPLQQITGQAWFYGLEFFVNQDVLIPRQDTEVLVEEVLKAVSGQEGLRILDLCTGSGCILISLLKNLEGAVGVGADISREALFVAEKNGRKLGVSADWICSDLFQELTGVFDVLVSNPPYIETAVIEELMEEVRLYEPRGALDGDEDGLRFYRAITAQAGQYLRPGGLLAFEIGYNQGDAVKALLEKAHYEEIRIVKDLAGLDRAVLGRKQEGKE